MAEHELHYVKPWTVARDWELYRPWLEMVPLNGLYDLGELKRSLVAAERHLWAIWEVDHSVAEMSIVACVVTSTFEYQLLKVGRINLCGGRDMVRWLNLVPELEQAFRDEGCDRVEVYGRRGWERVLDGYKLQACVLAKELR